MGNKNKIPFHNMKPIRGIGLCQASLFTVKLNAIPIILLKDKRIEKKEDDSLKQIRFNIYCLVIHIKLICIILTKTNNNITVTIYYIVFITYGDWGLTA